ncbi:hypothetical protein [Pengzhenrongella sp.]|jgi:hypothetical protein|uniref:hypothetical protein n=1 Tax=Pengzhenrongella sp. TaxID=2888820 RepID=UPI002F95B0DB
MTKRSELLGLVGKTEPSVFIQQTADSKSVIDTAAELESIAAELVRIAGDLGMSGPAADAAVDTFVVLSRKVKVHADQTTQTANAAIKAHNALREAKVAYEALPSGDVGVLEGAAIVAKETANWSALPGVGTVVGVNVGAAEVLALSNKREQAREDAADQAINNLNASMITAKSALHYAPATDDDRYAETAITPAHSVTPSTGSGAAGGWSSSMGGSGYTPRLAGGSGSGIAGGGSIAGGAAASLAQSAGGSGAESGSGIGGIGARGIGGALIGGVAVGGLALGAVALARSRAARAASGAGGTSGVLGRSSEEGAGGLGGPGRGGAGAGGLAGSRSGSTSGLGRGTSGSGAGSGLSGTTESEGAGAGSRAGGSGTAAGSRSGAATGGGAPMGGGGGGGAGGSSKGRRAGGGGHLAPHLDIADEKSDIDLGAGAKAGSRSELRAQRAAPVDDFEPDETW